MRSPFPGDYTSVGEPADVLQSRLSDHGIPLNGIPLNGIAVLCFRVEVMQPMLAGQSLISFLHGLHCTDVFLGCTRAWNMGR